MTHSKPRSVVDDVASSFAAVAGGGPVFASTAACDAVAAACDAAVAVVASAVVWRVPRLWRVLPAANACQGKCETQVSDTALVHP